MPGDKSKLWCHQQQHYFYHTGKEHSHIDNVWFVALLHHRHYYHLNFREFVDDDGKFGDYNSDGGLLRFAMARQRATCDSDGEGTCWNVESLPIDHRCCAVRCRRRSGLARESRSSFVAIARVVCRPLRHRGDGANFASCSRDPRMHSPSCRSGPGRRG